MSYKRVIQRFKNIKRHSKNISVLIILNAVLLIACGQGQDAGWATAENEGQVFETSGETSYQEKAITNADGDAESVVIDKKATEEDITEPAEADDIEELDELQGRFGRNCISEQTFEVELSEYDGKVWFVPYAPMGAEDFHMQIIQNGEVLEDISGYVPKELEGQKFDGLDAVSFFDINFDNMTDIVLIETYGDTNFAVVYYGGVYGELDGQNTQYSFYLQSWMTDNLADSVEEVTISSIRNYLGNGKKNGEYVDYREAYLAAARLYQLESTHEITYDLIFFDDDDMPELVADCPGYHVSLYTYSDGRLIPIIDRWGYGAGGNHGYEYCPRKGSVRNYDADYAGLILYTYYFELDEEYRLTPVVGIKLINFVDANGNGVPDGDEEETVGYGKLYIDDREITTEEYLSYSMGEYEWIGSGLNSMSLEELTTELNQK